MLQQLADDGRVLVLGISRDIRSPAAVEALHRAGVTYPNWLDSHGANMTEFFGLVPMQAIPSSVVILDGRARYAHIGPFTTRDDLAAHLPIS